MNKLKYFIIIISLTVISACNFSGDNPVSTTDKNTPNSPVPPDGATNQPNAIQLKWTSDNAASYDIYLDTVSPPNTLYASNRTSPDVVAAGLKLNTTYYWKVAAKLTDGTTKVGPVWRFSTASSASGQNGNLLLEHKIFTSAPSYVNIWFQVLDFDGKGITNLTTNDFLVLEDGMPISASESNLEIVKKSDIPYVTKVVLMLDNSASIGSDMQGVKDAANTFVSNLIPGAQTEVAVYKFSENSVLVQDFTSNIGLIQSAINGISVEFPTTDLFGAVIEGVGKWQDRYDIDNIEQGALVLFTDGTDTQGSHTLADALSASADKRVYTVGLGQEISPDTLKVLGNAGFYSAGNVNDLNNAFLQVQQDLIDYANSFYWLRYLSPKRGNNSHILELTQIGNANTGSGAAITDNFSSAGFYSTTPGLYIDPSASNPTGIDTVFLGKFSSTTITAASLLAANEPKFVWSQADTNIAVVQPIAGSTDGSQARITAKDSSAVTSTLILDQNNGNLSKRLYIKVR